MGDKKKTQQVILAIDQGTTSTRAILFDGQGRPVGKAQRELRQLYPQSGWVEHDPGDILRTVTQTARDSLTAAGLTADAVARARFK